MLSFFPSLFLKANTRLLVTARHQYVLGGTILVPHVMIHALSYDDSSQSSVLRPLVRESGWL